MDKEWEDKAIQILMDVWVFDRQFAEETVSGWDQEDIKDMTPEEAVEEEMSYWGEG